MRTWRTWRLRLPSRSAARVRHQRFRRDLPVLEWTKRSRRACRSPRATAASGETRPGAPHRAGHAGRVPRAVVTRFAAWHESGRLVCAGRCRLARSQALGGCRSEDAQAGRKNSSRRPARATASTPSRSSRMDGGDRIVRVRRCSCPSPTSWRTSAKRHSPICRASCRSAAARCRPAGACCWRRYSWPTRSWQVVGVVAATQDLGRPAARSIARTRVFLQVKEAAGFRSRRLICARARTATPARQPWPARG